MTNKEIIDNVDIIVNNYLKGFEVNSKDAPIIKASIDLIANLLININTIANK